MAKDLFDDAQREAIENAVRDAENETSGEIQVHIENHCKGDVMDRAAEVFAQMKMHKTKLRNGVLFYVAIKDHKFAILGDVGINAKVPDNFWENIKNNIILKFSLGQYTEGLVEGIVDAGNQLKAHFPNTSDKNELSDDISFGTN